MRTLSDIGRKGGENRERDGANEVDDAFHHSRVANEDDSHLSLVAKLQIVPPRMPKMRAKGLRRRKDKISSKPRRFEVQAFDSRSDEARSGGDTDETTDGP